VAALLAALEAGGGQAGGVPPELAQLRAVVATRLAPPAELAQVCLYWVEVWGRGEADAPMRLLLVAPHGRGLRVGGRVSAVEVLHARPPSRGGFVAAEGIP
jgi:hypothetical protein